MPKEIAHMSVAQTLRKTVSADSVFHDAIGRFPNLYLYGSVAPDSCFFYLFGPGYSKVRRVSQIFHRPDASSMLPIIKLLKRYGTHRPDVLAFAAGLLCHLITDTVFHPMVFYFAGLDDVHEGATQRHRILETAMDLHFRSMNRFSKTLMPPRILSNVEISNAKLSRLLQQLYCPDNTAYQKYLLYAFRSHWLAGQLFLNGKFIHKRSVFKKAFAPEFRAVFYPFNHPVQLDFFNRPLSYQDPERGGDYQNSIGQLIGQSVTQCTALLSVVEKWLLSENRQEDLLLDPECVEIRPCPPLEAERFKYWYGACDMEKKLYGNVEDQR